VERLTLYADVNTFTHIHSRDCCRYAMYNMNLDNVTHLPNGDPCGRTDELGHFVMRYSDDAGRHWSEQRYEVPYRCGAEATASLDCIIIVTIVVMFSVADPTPASLPVHHLHKMRTCT
jgi:hypothetical protein